MFSDDELLIEFDWFFFPKTLIFFAFLTLFKLFLASDELAELDVSESTFELEVKSSFEGISLLACGTDSSDDKSFSLALRGSDLWWTFVEEIDGEIEEKSFEGILEGSLLSRDSGLSEVVSFPFEGFFPFTLIFNFFLTRLSPDLSWDFIEEFDGEIKSSLEEKLEGVTNCVADSSETISLELEGFFFPFRLIFNFFLTLLSPDLWWDFWDEFDGELKEKSKDLDGEINSSLEVLDGEIESLFREKLDELDVEIALFELLDGEIKLNSLLADFKWFLEFLVGLIVVLLLQFPCLKFKTTEIKKIKWENFETFIFLV